MNGEVVTLSRAVNDSGTMPPVPPAGFAQAQMAVNNLSSQLPGLETAFTEIQMNSNVQNFSSTLDAIDFVELVR